METFGFLGSTIPWALSRHPTLAPHRKGLVDNVIPATVLHCGHDLFLNVSGSPVELLGLYCLGTQLIECSCGSGVEPASCC